MTATYPRIWLQQHVFEPQGHIVLFGQILKLVKSTIYVGFTKSGHLISPKILHFILLMNFHTIFDISLCINIKRKNYTECPLHKTKTAGILGLIKLVTDMHQTCFIHALVMYFII